MCLKLILVLTIVPNGFVDHTRELNRRDLGSESTTVRENIRSAFEFTDGYLMPRPGDKVRDGQDFDGRIGG